MVWRDIRRRPRGHGGKNRRIGGCRRISRKTVLTHESTLPTRISSPIAPDASSGAIFFMTPPLPGAHSGEAPGGSGRLMWIRINHRESAAWNLQIPCKDKSRPTKTSSLGRRYVSLGCRYNFHSPHEVFNTTQGSHLHCKPGIASRPASHTCPRPATTPFLNQTSDHFTINITT